MKLFLLVAENEGPHEILSYARHSGFLPYNTESDVKKLNLTNGFAVHTLTLIKLFFDHDITICKREERQMLCFDHAGYSWVYPSVKIIKSTVVLELFQRFQVDINNKMQIAIDYESFLRMKKAAVDFKGQQQSDSNGPMIVTIRELYEKYQSEHLDWLQMINKQLLSDSKNTLDDEILIWNPQLFERLYRIFVGLDET